MAKSSDRARKAKETSSTPRHYSDDNGQSASSNEAVKAAEKVAMEAFSSGLRLAAAFGTVAAKTASLALTSLATGADKFSELVKKEAMKPRPSSSRKRGNLGASRRRGQRRSRARSKGPSRRPR